MRVRSFLFVPGALALATAVTLAQQPGGPPGPPDTLQILPAAALEATAGIPVDTPGTAADIAGLTAVDLLPFDEEPLEAPGGPVEEPHLPGVVSFKVRDVVAPAGAIAQLKLEITEPMPITTGTGLFSFGAFESFDGIALTSPGQDAYGVAVVGAGQLALRFTSLQATLGTDSDYPFLTLAARVPATAQRGDRFPFVPDVSALEFRDPAGAPYPFEAEGGSVVVGRSVAIHDVIPGSGDLPAGAVVTVLGSGFDRRTKIKLGDALVQSTRLVSPERIDVVLGSPARMHGMRIRARNKDSRVEYFSYQRTYRVDPSDDAVLRNAVPLFPLQLTSAAAVTLATDTRGIAVQNIGDLGAVVTLELTGAGGQILETATVALAGSRYVVRTLAEIFPAAAAVAGDTVFVRSATPIQVMGIDVDAAGSATPNVAATIGF